MTATAQWTLQQLLPEAVDTPLASLVIGGLSQDSRTLVPGDLFFARAGLAHRGLDFIPAAVEAGAVAVLVDETERAALADTDFGVPVLALAGLARRIGPLASLFYGEPSRAMLMIGITGTNGKTSCAHYIAQALNQAGRRTALIGTVGNGFIDALAPASHTTPDPIALQRLLADLRRQGADAVVMEVSSHALEQGRVEGVAFDVAAFSNLSRDHLDYHGSMQAYGDAKARLLESMQVPLLAINADDPFGRSLLARPYPDARQVLAFGMTDDADLYPVSYQLNSRGMQLQLHTTLGEMAIQNRLLGHFNLSNLLLSAAVLQLAGLDAAQLQQGLNGLSPVCGRMECFGGGELPLVVVDYAHTPDALEKALQALVEHARGQLWCLFGCGGDRDTGKRAQMGAVASALADQVVITSDNPRTEAPEVIIAMIQEGVDSARPCSVEPDRALAIGQTLARASAGDIVLIAGKGHEDYQEINGQRRPFSDQQVAQQALAARKQGAQS
ncbi:UDP-N-acetylmuramoyl-L-alanyl-D-glutamate--2,6-diaminopimelate ligase [Marinobacterium rhizophilum]|uniref:UDP-N-acetylmuramoyl-L-alanyl-D-glutamate--2,6-diaminopimelate ligase n=1 Tax=Marinobacterium rhizophilum TaxID=420402 RepID=A0ABY5HNU6_9GAMM|nr:UDP-N-acetylmuramoyl-L-alanyl-D-glutamate--2,6-diaminopimelate ligase [Marinobacterium rhizophilum]UTW14101.1 UDP-N-acetylmuramoyl-L-alanyl-D-glutamate--2,6-diaminopimelate ligase [Marinobacterium rhizophilum]